MLWWIDRLPNRMVEAVLEQLLFRIQVQIEFVCYFVHEICSQGKMHDFLMCENSESEGSDDDDEEDKRDLEGKTYTKAGNEVNSI